MTHFRACCRSRLVALLLAALTVLGSGGSWHVDPGDPDSGGAVTVHDHSAHQARLGVEQQSAPVGHCAICHWLQAFRADGVRRARVHVPGAAEQRAPRAALAAVRSGGLLDVPSRAPPA